jgi:ribonuclease HII
MIQRPHLEYENAAIKPVVGMDEAGCGPWAGPLVVGAVILPQTLLPFYRIVNDSKLLSAKKREAIYDELMAHNDIITCVGIVSVNEIDTYLLRKALPLAFHRAIDAFPMKPMSALIDGVRDPKIDIPTTLIKKGDQLSLSIACASIVAKVTRDRMMKTLDMDYPMYGWGKNAGYGTKLHQEALERFGVTCHHRRSYAPIQPYLKTSC